MFICIIVLALLLPAAFLPLALSAFTPAALDEMGVCLEAPEPASEPADAHSPRTERRVSQSTSLEVCTLCS
jgi:hypothetical protein